MIMRRGTRLVRAHLFFSRIHCRPPRSTVCTESHVGLLELNYMRGFVGYMIMGINNAANGTRSGV